MVRHRVDEEVELPTDPQERKRILNVLAQRRYRLRKRKIYTRLRTLDEQQSVLDQSHSSRSSSSSNDGVSSSNQLTLATDRTSLILEDGSQTLDSFLPMMDFSDFLQQDEVLSSTFSDDHLIQVPELDLLRAAVDIAIRLNSDQLLWDFNAISIFNTDTYPVDLPANLQPTNTQLTIAHHPVLDIFPWPDVRDRLIKVFALPNQTHSLIGLIYDLEAPGVKIRGHDPCSSDSWEFEQTFVDSWWWALDWSVIRETNSKRRARGATEIVLKK